MSYEFELAHNAAETTQNIYCVKGESFVWFGFFVE